jgi:hypothetical protein
MQRFVRGWFQRLLDQVLRVKANEVHSALGVEPQKVLQRRRNHGTFKLYRVAQEERPDLVERFAVEELPVLVVVEGERVQARLERPRGCREIEEFLAPWLN